MNAKIANLLGIKYFSLHLFWHVVLHPFMTTSAMLDMQIENDALREKLTTYLAGKGE